jgi:hypothetical protein
MLIYCEILLPPNSLECVGSAAPTSQVYASSTVVQLITESHKLLLYAYIQ